MRVAGLVVGWMVGALLVVAAVDAQAHYLTLREAKDSARQEAARVGARIGAETTIPTCRRRNDLGLARARHVVDCTARYRFPDKTTCENTIRVKFATAKTYKLKVSFPHEPVCET